MTLNSIFSLFWEDKSKLDRETLLKNRVPITGLIKGDNFGFEQKVSGNHVYMETGEGQPIIFCHGLFGSFRNFGQIGQELSSRFRVIVPCMPMYDAPLKKCTVEELAIYLEIFISDLGLKNCIVVGNSMGGGTVLKYAIHNLANVDKIILFASSGLSFIPMKGGYMKLKEISYVRDLLRDIFFDSSVLSEDEIYEVYKVMQNKQMLLRCLRFTSSTKRNFLHQDLKQLDIPTLVIWGNNDKVTPPFIGKEFESHIKNSTLHYLENCGHVPCYEKPTECLEIINEFLSRIARPKLNH